MYYVGLTLADFGWQTSGIIDAKLWVCVCVCAQLLQHERITIQYLQKQKTHAYRTYRNTIINKLWLY